MTLRKLEVMLEIETGSTRSHSVEKWLWNRLSTCRKTDCGMYERMTEYACNCETIKKNVTAPD
jgi:hypothetical protein